MSKDPETVCPCTHQVSRHGSPVSLTYPEGSGGHSAAAAAAASDPAEASEAFAGGASEVMAAADLWLADFTNLKEEGKMLKCDSLLVHPGK